MKDFRTRMTITLRFEELSPIFERFIELSRV